MGEFRLQAARKKKARKKVAKKRCEQKQNERGHGASADKKFSKNEKREKGTVWGRGRLYTKGNLENRQMQIEKRIGGGRGFLRSTHKDRR